MGMWNGKVQRLRLRATSVRSSAYTVVVVLFFHRVDSACHAEVFCVVWGIVLLIEL